jgi:hypothetical protein
LEGKGKVSFDELSLWSAIRVAENQMVLLRPVKRNGDLPIDHLIVSGIQLVGCASRPALGEIVEFLFIQEQQANIGSFVTGGIRVTTLGKGSEVAVYP